MIKNNPDNFEINDQFQKALDYMENTHEIVYIAGRAGTGKSTLLNIFRQNTEKNIVVLAPTGVAALNVKGQTIHSFFKFRPDVTLQSIKKIHHQSALAQTIQNIDTIIIDEISMVRADLLDCVEKFLRLNGKNQNELFGGTQMIFIGDLYQLPPVVSRSEKEIFPDHYKSPYFFSAKCLTPIDYPIIELEKIYRQKDARFIKLLNSIRTNSISSQDLELLNSRVSPSFQELKNHFYIYLTATNQQAEALNHDKLDQLNHKSFFARGTTVGSFDTKSLPTQIDLELKVGAQVMMLNNDNLKRWVNGSIGKITKIKNEKYKNDAGKEIERSIVEVKLGNGRKIEVLPYTWELFNFYYDISTRCLESEPIGAFTQYPMKLAWAVTIHKSQGKTFDNVILDIGSGTFVHGQVYVALSRCTSFEGLILKKSIQKRHIIMDGQVVKFMSQKANGSFEEKIAKIQNAIDNEQTIEIIYQKENSTSTRLISPNEIGEMQYMGCTFIGLSAFCHSSQSTRHFRLDRIVDIKTVS